VSEGNSLLPAALAKCVYRQHTCLD
jgi:hypothetical protein